VLEAEDYFTKKRAELGLDRADRLAEIQSLVDTWYPGQIHAKSLNNGVLQLVTPSSVVAGELRLRQVELVSLFSKGEVVTRLRISIESR
jgi:hypothetical protein